jgi:hypothetical protein
LRSDASSAARSLKGAVTGLGVEPVVAFDGGDGVCRIRSRPIEPGPDATVWQVKGGRDRTGAGVRVGGVFLYLLGLVGAGPAVAITTVGPGEGCGAVGAVG